MLRLLLFSISYVLLGAFNSPAQISNCVKGDFIKDIGKSENLMEAEDKLCAEIKENSDLQEIYGFVISSKFGQVVRVYKNRVVFTYYEDHVRYSERDLTSKEIVTLRNLLNELNPESQPPLRDYKHCTDMCLQYEFLNIDRNGGRRVSIFSQRYRPPKPMDKLADFFNGLRESGDFKNHYYIQSEVKDFELLLADRVWSAVAVWKNGNDFRVLVGDASKWQENFDAARKYFENSMPTSGLETYEQRLKRLKRRAEIQYAHYSWRKFENGKLGEIVSAPDEAPYFDTSWRYSANGYEYLNPCVGENDCALVKVNESQKLIMIRKGNYETSDMVVSPDGHWLVTAKEDPKTGWENLVRINLQTSVEFPVDLELSYDFDVIAYLKAHNKFLVRQRKWAGYQKEPLLIPFLLDAEKGKVEKVEGDFAPLIFADRKPLQPTKKPNVFWAAKRDYEGNTQFGIYDTKLFMFKPLTHWSDIEFDSNSMWVDEKEMKIYFVYGGHLLALPLPKTNL